VINERWADIKLPCADSKGTVAQRDLPLSLVNVMQLIIFVRMGRNLPCTLILNPGKAGNADTPTYKELL
jgi:hypothetical protein